MLALDLHWWGVFAKNSRVCFRNYIEESIEAEKWEIEVNQFVTTW